MNSSERTSCQIWFTSFDFGEEAVASHVEPESLVFLGACESADDVALLYHDRVDLSLRQFVSRCQAGRAGADHDKIPWLIFLELQLHDLTLFSH